MQTISACSEKFGRCLYRISVHISVLLLGQAAACAQPQTLHMIGTIDSRYGIKMTLNRDGNNIEGSYNYVRVGTPLRLEGTIDNSGKLVLREFDPHGLCTGGFVAKLVDGKRLIGNWSDQNENGQQNPKSGKHLPCLLTLAGDATALENGKDGIIITQSIKKTTMDHPPGCERTIAYPVVMKEALANQLLAKRIQSCLSLERVLGNSPDALIDEARQGDLSNVEYRVNYNRNYLVDADYTQEYLSAFPSQSSTHVLVNIKTGQVVRAKDAFLSSALPRLKIMIKQKQQVAARAQLKKHAKDEGELETFKREVAKSQQYLPIDANNFAVNDSGIMFIYNWQFPHAILGWEPDNRYFFSFQTLKPFIRNDGPLEQFIK